MNHLTIVPPNGGDDREPTDAELTDRSVAEASASLDRHKSAFTPWPWNAVQELAGPLIAGDRPTIIAAYTGQGKTTFVNSLIAELYLRDVSVYCMPLETEAREFYKQLACLMEDVYYREVVTNAWRYWPNHAEIRERLNWRLDSLRSDEGQARLYVSRERHVDFPRLVKTARHAHDRHAKVLIVDHVDEIIAPDDRNAFQESVRVLRETRKLAQELQLRIILCSQLNNDVARGSVMARFEPPQLPHLYQGQHKAQVAATVLGLYRPLRRDATREQRNAVDRHQAAPSTLLAPNRVGVAILKSAAGVSTPGAKVELKWHQGRVMDIPPAER